MMRAEWMTDTVLGRVQQLASIAAELGLSMAQLAVAWVLQNDNVAAAIIGASRPEQIQENVAAVSVKLDDDVLAQIDKVLGDAILRDPTQVARG
jgi:aryl-alcohol dehydrogenase-like predicted oxidoreductase